MKKYRIKSPVRFIACLCAFILLNVFLFTSVFGFNDVMSMDRKSFVTVKVNYGDTLWQLAKDYGSADKDIRHVIYDIEQFNNIKASDLYAGMYITIPQ